MERDRTWHPLRRKEKSKLSGVIKMSGRPPYSRAFLTRNFFVSHIGSVQQCVDCREYFFLDPMVYCISCGEILCEECFDKGEENRPDSLKEYCPRCAEDNKCF